MSEAIQYIAEKINTIPLQSEALRRLEIYECELKMYPTKNLSAKETMERSRLETDIRTLKRILKTARLH